MKKYLLIMVGVYITLNLGAYINLNEKQENLNKDEKSEKYIKEEKKETNREIKENIRYKFAKVKSINGTMIEVEYVEPLGGYKNKGHNENLQVDRATLKSTGEKDQIDLFGIECNFNSIDKIKSGMYVRLGFCALGNSKEKVNYEKVISVYTILER